MSEYRIAEKKNCFDHSRFYIQEIQGRSHINIHGTWEDILGGADSCPIFFDSYEKAFDYIKNEYRNEYTEIVKTTEITVEDIKRWVTNGTL